MYIFLSPLSIERLFYILSYKFCRQRSCCFTERIRSSTRLCLSSTRSVVWGEASICKAIRPLFASCKKILASNGKMESNFSPRWIHEQPFISNVPFFMWSSEVRPFGGKVLTLDFQFSFFPLPELEDSKVPLDVTEELLGVNEFHLSSLLLLILLISFPLPLPLFTDLTVLKKQRPI